MQSKTCLFIVPKKFYSFEKHIVGALTRKGFAVTVANDEYPANMLGKIMGKLQLPWLANITYKVINDNYLAGKHYDVVIIIKGRGMSKKLIAALKKSAHRVLAYNWDSFKYNPGPLKWYKSVDRYFTFDYLDAQNYQVSLLPLFTSSISEKEDKREIKYELSYIVRNHSGRLKYIDNVITLLQPASTFIYIYEQNVFTQIENFLKNPSLYIKYRKSIFLKPLSYADYTDAIKGSNFTVDYAHNDQTGITMRCFEAVKMSVKIITNNLYMTTNDCFDETNTIVYNITDDPGKLKTAYEYLKNQQPAATSRSVDDFIDDMLTV